LAKILDERFYGRYGLPHKFKMGVTGCPNSCTKPQEHDLGLMAVIEPALDEEGVE
jgi:dissimilatory sulfite reductase (desulfoviridin) alpha/beta subunit